jgi:hypothetical protein
VEKSNIRPAGESSEETYLAIDPSYKQEASTGGSPVKDVQVRSYNNDFEIEDLMMQPDPFEQFENYASSSCEMASYEEDNLRASAESFYPNKAPKMDLPSMIHVSLSQYREQGDLLSKIKELLDKLPKDQKLELFNLLNDGASNFDHKDVEQY